MTYEIGKFYRVPCLQTVERLRDGYRPMWHGEFIPINGPLHRDAEHVNFPWLHWHIDLRFVSARVFKELGLYLRSPYSTPLQKHPVWHRTWPRESNTERHEDSFVVGDVQVRPMKCKREWPAYPCEKARWLPALEREYCETKLRGMVCPHRGISLEGAPRDGDVVTCPGHGLRWNVETGALVTSQHGDGEIK